MQWLTPVSISKYDINMHLKMNVPKVESKCGI